MNAKGIVFTHHIHTNTHTQRPRLFCRNNFLLVVTLLMIQTKHTRHPLLLPSTHTPSKLVKASICLTKRPFSIPNNPLQQPPIPLINSLRFKSTLIPKPPFNLSPHLTLLGLSLSSR